MVTLEVTPAEEDKTPKRRRKPTAKRLADATATAEMILDVVDGIGQEVAGEAGAIAPLERGLMQDPLARILARQDPAKLGQYASVLDPLLLAAGALMYAARVSKAVRPAKPAAPPVSQNLTPTPETDPRAGAKLTQNLRPVAPVG